ncbi:MAG: hypothetical protein FJW23_00985 [Acidimicrobiia bacterium]|nr:hypothetical protein [Acidimicrobiia bacterium]
MKRLMAACALLFVAAASSPALAQSRLDFRLVNQTGFVIVELYVSPTNAKSWEEDILGEDVLPHNRAVDIRFSRSEKSCTWDMKIVDEDGDEVEWTNLDLCEASEVTLRYERGTPTALID